MNRGTRRLEFREGIEVLFLLLSIKFTSEILTRIISTWPDGHCFKLYMVGISAATGHTPPLLGGA